MTALYLSEGETGWRLRLCDTGVVVVACAP